MKLLQWKTVLARLRPLGAAWLLPIISLPLAAAGEKTVDQMPPGGVPPVPIRRQAPLYPEPLAFSRITGRVLVEFIIDTQGKVINPVVVSSNNPWFERAALNAILEWTFKPGEVNGQKVNVRGRQELLFEMESGGGHGLWDMPSGRGLDKLPEEYRWAKAPEPVNTAFAIYPLAALQAGVKGKARINFIVGPNGRVVEAKVIETAVPEFGAAMQAMIDTWVFTPPTNKDGKRCYALLSIQHNFSPNTGDVPVTEGARQILRSLAKHPEKILELSALDHVPKPLSRRSPVYPSGLLAAGKKGSAVIQFYIDEEGDAQLPSIVSSTDPEFGYAAVQAVATWRYERPLKNGKPVVARAQIPLDFDAPEVPKR